MRHELLTRDELAERFGVDVRTITNRVQEGMPQRTRSGKPVYSWQECRDWWEARIRDDARATRHAGGDESIKKEMAELRLREQRAITEQAEAEVFRVRGQQVGIDFMTSEFRRMAEALRAGLLSIPAAWEGRLAPCTTAVERQIALQEGVDELLPLLGIAADDDGEGDAPQSGTIEDVSADEGADPEDPPEVVAAS